MTDAASCELEPSAKQLWDARLIDFGWAPNSAEAERLVAHLVEWTLRWEPKRRKRSKLDALSLANAVARMVGGLAVATEQAPCVVRCPKSNNAFTDLPLAARQFRAVFAAFTGSTPALIRKHASGGRLKYFENAYIGHLERIGPTGAFVELLRDHGIASGTARGEHFKWRSSVPEAQLISLREPSSWSYWEKRKRKGEQVKFEETERTRHMRGEVLELNSFLEGVELDGGYCAGWSRKFNQRDVADFGFDGGGRLYAWPLGSAYQGLSKEERKAITIAGERTVEVDLRSSHLTILYALCGQSLAEYIASRGSDDPYAVAGIPRDVVKVFVTVTLGQGKPANKWPKEAAKELLEEKEPIDLDDYPIANVSEPVLALHPILSSLSGVGWATLQFVESEVILRSMLRLARDHSMLALPVHDSLIVPASAEMLTRAVLSEEFTAVVGKPPILPAPSYAVPLAA